MRKPFISPDELRSAIIDALVRRLGDAGKIKIQKLVYFLQEAYQLPLACRFHMHHFGPYSEDIESNISNLKFMGYVNVQRDPDGYGFHLTPTSSAAAPNWNILVASAEEQIGSVIDQLGPMDASQLELVATIHFIRSSFGFNKGAVISSVRARKPKFSRKLITEAYDNLAGMGLL